MPTGKVKFFNVRKGYGFIIDDETKKEVFVHATGLIDPKLKENDEVTFDIEPEENGKVKAVNVKRKQDFSFNIIQTSALSILIESL